MYYSRISSPALQRGASTGTYEPVHFAKVNFNIFIYIYNTIQRYTSMVSTYDHSTKTCERNMFLTTSAASYMDIDIDEVRYSYKAIL